MTSIPRGPTDTQRDLMVSLLSPLARITRPRVFGIENVPARDTLLVGNHTLYGILDVPFMIAELWAGPRVPVRILGDHAHYNFPVWRDILELCGTVRGTPENVHQMMAAGENLLVFPGGSREVNKRRGEKYQLMWKERLGFVRLAIEHGYAIVPFAAVGAEEMFDILIDDGNPIYGRLSGLVQRLSGWPIQPVVRGIGPTIIPRPERLYFWFGEAIETVSLGGHQREETARDLRDEVREQVETGIGFLLAQRDADPRRSLRARIFPE